MKKLFWNLFFASLFCYGIYDGIIRINNQFKDSAEQTYSGTVACRSADEVVIKHGTQTELYLIINFDVGVTKAVNVGTTTYFTNQTGDRVSFELSREDLYGETKIHSSNAVDIFSLILTFISFIIASIYLLVFAIKFLNRILDGTILKKEKFKEALLWPSYINFDEPII